MAKILIGWELGGNYGHLVSIRQLSSDLTKAGHECYLALQRIDSNLGCLAAGEHLLQAPIWPNLLKDVHRARPKFPHATYGDIFSALCLDRPFALRSMIEGWQALLDLIKPDLVVAETAPALLMSARDFVPTIRIGSGYDVPPHHMKRFPTLTGEGSVQDEALAVEKINAALSQTSRQVVQSFPEMLKADVDIVACFREFDPYADWRKTEYCFPAIGPIVPPIAVNKGKEIFVYFHSVSRLIHPIWQALSKTKIPIRIHIPNVEEEHKKAFEDLGFKYESIPVPLNKIMKRSRMIISHGGLGLSSAAILCGMPHMIISHDVEKSLNGTAVSKFGAGIHNSIFELDTERLEEQILSTYSDIFMEDACMISARHLRNRRLDGVTQTTKRAVLEIID
jgi:UDP:flavonoid glycosyltransferase YjiC (YdhE family)